MSDNAEDVARLLGEHRAQLKQAEADFELQQARVWALRKIVEGYEAYAAIFAADPVPASVVANGAEPGDVVTIDETEGVEPEGPRGEEAVHLILKEAKRPMHARDVTQRVVERQWIRADAKYPSETVRSALNRMVDKGTAARDGKGRYYLATIDETTELSPDSEAPMT